MAAKAILKTKKVASLDTDGTKSQIKCHYFTVISGIKNVTEWFLIFSKTILIFKSKMTAQKWPLIPYWKTWKVKIRWDIEMNKVSFRDNPESTNLIEWYLLYFWIVLTIKFKMTPEGYPTLSWVRMCGPKFRPPITKPEKTQICDLCLNHLFREGPFFKPISTFYHVNWHAWVLLDNL